MPRLAKNVARAIAWERGRLLYKLNPSQKKMDAAYRGSKGKIFVANCSRRIGKTFWVCCKAIETALNCPNPYPRIVLAAATKIDLKRFILPAFEQILVDCPPDMKPVWKASEAKFTFPENKAEIHLIGLDKRPDAGRGQHCDLYIFEEARDISRMSYIYSSVVSPMLITRPGARTIVSSTPATSPAHPFQSFCERAQFDNSYVEITIDDNTMLTAEQKAEALAECLTESDKLREYYCKHVVDENLAITHEWKAEYEKDIERPGNFKYMHRYVGMDLGTKIDLTALIFGYYDRKLDKIIIEDEAEMTGPAMTTSGLKALIEDKEKEMWPEMGKPYRRVSDNDNPLLLQTLSIEHQLYFVSTGKDELKAMVDFLRILIKQGKIIVSPKCKKLLGCLRYAIWDKHRKAFGRSPVYGHFDHLAALMYLVRNVDFYTNPFPRLDPGITSDTHHIRVNEGIEDFEEILKFKKIFGL